MKDDILAAVIQAKEALVVGTNDSEHDALVDLMRALGHEVPECNCEYIGPEDEHGDDCPSKAWEVKK